MEVENLAVTTDDGEVNMIYTEVDTYRREVVQILQTINDIIKESFLQMTNLSSASVQGQDPQNNTDSTEVMQSNQPLRNPVDTQYEAISPAEETHSNNETSEKFNRNDSNTFPIQEQRLQLQEIPQQRNNENNQQAPGMLQANQNQNFNMPYNGLPKPFMDQYYRHPPPDNRSDYNEWH